jgi:hypothetical protein
MERIDWKSLRFDLGRAKLHIGIRMAKGRPVTPDTYRSIGLLSRFQSNAIARTETAIRTAARAATVNGRIRSGRPT